MISALLSLLLIFILLLITERLWRKSNIHNEVTRKIIHISIAVFVSFWPYYLSFHWIEVISILFLIVIFASRQLGIFGSIHSVKRKTFGELLFPIGIGLSALLAPSKTIFTIAMLNVGLADGFAAIAGTFFSKTRGMKIFGDYKTLVGSIAFWFTSLIIIFIFKVFQVSGANLTWSIVFLLPISTAAIEYLSPFGTDDITIPMLIVIVLRWL